MKKKKESLKGAYVGLALLIALALGMCYWTWCEFKSVGEVTRSLYGNNSELYTTLTLKDMR